MTPVIITIAHNLGIKVVAEGVELKEQKDYLIENDCDIMQGFLFSKPISEKEAIDLIYKVNK